jgi:MTH538 TIR-like domain (DUF1863)
MPALRTYRIFISHCWEYNRDYYRIVDWFNTERLFEWRNLSVPEDRALREDKRFESRLRKRLGDSDVLLVIIGMEIAHRHWIKWEIKWARIRGIPILGVMPNGAQRVPKIVEECRCPIVGWRRDSVIGAIRGLAAAQQ